MKRDDRESDTREVRSPGGSPGSGNNSHNQPNGVGGTLENPAIQHELDNIGHQNNNEGTSGTSVETRESGESGESGASGASETSDNRHEVGIFERLMDNVLGTNRARNGSMSNESSGGPGSSTTNTSVIPGEDLGNSGAIIITVNYVFSDENIPQVPNRSGSLIMTLPNSPSNRDPHVIQEFIRLATQMAYSTIINGLHKERGITVDKFNSFPIKDVEQESSKNCAICFEEFDHVKCFNHAKLKEEVPEIGKDTQSRKRQKLNDSSSIGESDHIHDGGAYNASDLHSVNSNSSTQTTSNESGKELLSDYKGTFTHLPVEMPCGHIFGKSCLFEWLKSHKTCPLCRAAVVDPDAEESQNASQRPAPTMFAAGDNGNNLAGPPGLRQSFTIVDRSDRSSDIMRNFYNRDRQNDDHPPAFIRSNTETGRSSGREDRTNRRRNPFSPSSGGPDDNSTERTNGVLSHVMAYLRRPPQDSMFEVGLASRRTAEGVQTSPMSRQESNETTLDYMNLGGLVNNNNATSHNTESRDNARDTSNSNIINNANENANHTPSNAENNS